MPESKARNRGQEHPGVDLDRALPELLPVDYTGSVAQVEDVPRVEGPVDQLTGLLRGLHSNQLLGGCFVVGIEELVGRLEHGRGNTCLIEHAPRSAWRPDPNPTS